MILNCHSTFSAARWLKGNIILLFSIVVPFFVGGYYWGKWAQEDYCKHPGIDAAEAKWGTLEAYVGSAIVFGGVGALVFYVARAIIKSG
jgi:hypothetical protein